MTAEPDPDDEPATGDGEVSGDDGGVSDADADRGSDGEHPRGDGGGTRTPETGGALPFQEEPADLDEIGHGLLESEMGPSSSVAHLYRGEVHRMKFWRERLDTTTRWAIMIMAAILTWTFASPLNPHYLLLFAGLELLLFAGIEAQRFRGYDVWRSRVRELQRNVFAPGLDPDGDPPEPGWRRRLADHYRQPAVFIPFEEALAHRLRRVYLPQLGIVFAAWVVRVTVYEPGPAWPASAAIGAIPGTTVTSIVGLVGFCTLVIALRPRNWTAAREVAADGFR